MIVIILKGIYGREFSTLVELSGMNAGGDSGGGVYDLEGNLIGINTARNGTDDDTIGSNIYLDLGNPTVQSFIYSNTDVPEPGSGALLLLGIAAALRRNLARPSHLPASARIM